MQRLFTLLCFAAVAFWMACLTGCKKEEPTTPTTPSTPTGLLTLHENVLVVDSTRFRLDTTPALLAAGTYRFTASAGTLNAPIGTVIVGEQGLGFLRKVTATTTQGLQTTLQTEPASLDQVFSGGKLKLRISSDSLVGRGTANAGFHYELLNPAVLQSGPSTLTLRTLTADLTPNWNIDADFDATGLKTLEVAARGGTLDGKVMFNATAGGAASSPSTTTRLKRFTKIVRLHVAVGPIIVPVPVLMVLELNIEHSAFASAGFSRDITYESHSTFDLGMSYANGQWQSIYAISKPVNTLDVGTRTVGATANVQVAFVPKVSFLLYGTLGPFTSLGLQSEFQARVNGQTLDADYQGDLWLESKVGITGKLFGKQLPDYFTSSQTNKLTYLSPFKLALTSGNAQVGSANQALPVPLKVRVLDDDGKPVEGVRVSFAPASSNGTVSPALALTDATGYAQSVWTLGGASGTQRVTATVKKADGQAIVDAPVTFSATNTCAMNITPAQVLLLTNGSSKTWRLVNSNGYAAAGVIPFVFTAAGQCTWQPYTVTPSGTVLPYLASSLTTETTIFCMSSADPNVHVKLFGRDHTISSLTTTSFTAYDGVGSYTFTAP